MGNTEKNKLLSLEEVCDFLRDNDNYVILTHANPDGDTLGSAFGLGMLLAKMKKKVKVLCPDNIPDKYNYFTTLLEQTENLKNPTIIAVDVADAKLLGALEKEYGNKVELCIDHHFSNKCYAANTYLDSNAAANCECIYSIAIALAERVNKNMALALYTGISTDTGCFRFSNTTAKTLRIAADLMETGIDTAEINRIMFETKSRSRIELEKMAIEGMEFYFDDKLAVITITRDMIESVNADDADLEGVTSISRSVEGVLVGATIRQKPDGSYKASVRTYPPLDASEICKKLGGGGHIRAAGCQFDATLTEKMVKEKIIEQVKIALEENCAGTVTY